MEKKKLIFKMAERSYYRTRGDILTGHRGLRATLADYEALYGCQGVSNVRAAYLQGK